MKMLTPTPKTRLDSRRLMARFTDKMADEIGEHADRSRKDVDVLVYELSTLSVHIKDGPIETLSTADSDQELIRKVIAYTDTPLGIIEDIEMMIQSAKRASDPVTSPVPPDDMDLEEKKDD